MKIKIIFFLFLILHTKLILADTNYIKIANNIASSAVISLLNESKKYYDKKEYEKSAAVLERALRIEARNPILWHNLGGVRLQQKNWKRTISLAAKSNSYTTRTKKNKLLRLRNWVLISLACKGMKDEVCRLRAEERINALLKK
jgi:tetratricopeptide (TPR) repeat protein